MSSNITLYTWPTPNGIKASITLEELGLAYKTEGLDISSNSNPQKEEYTTTSTTQYDMSHKLMKALEQMVPEDQPQRPHPRPTRWLAARL